jgi:hypothetical protein
MELWVAILCILLGAGLGLVAGLIIATPRWPG